MALPRFEIIEDEAVPQPRTQQAVPGNDAAFSALMLALKTLSQKTIIALSRLGGFAALMSVFWLAMTLRSPDTNQLILLGLYSLFVLAGIWLIRR
jgi:hypothetical protein